AFVALPGGFGTLDELFEALTLIQTRKVANFPIVLLGVSYWRPLQELLPRLAAAGTIDPSDLDLMLITDDVSAGVEHIRSHVAQRFGVMSRPRRPFPVLGERPA